jgi:hypothetical protein
MARQIGSVIGVAGLIAVLSHISPTDPVLAFRHSLVMIGSLFAGAMVFSAVLLTARPSPSLVPTPVAQQPNALTVVSQPPGVP